MQIPVVDSCVLFLSVSILATATSDDYPKGLPYSFFDFGDHPKQIYKPYLMIQNLRTCYLLN